MTNNTEHKAFEEWGSVALEAMRQQYIQNGALSAERLSRGAIGAYINALEHELKAALSQRENSATPLKQVGEWVMVPREPTDDMIVAFAEEWYSQRQTIDDPQMLEAYAAMLSAAPAPKQDELAESSCTAEEAAELACELGYGSGGGFVLSDDELAAIINVDRAKR
jgi:hypothetical protein